MADERPQRGLYGQRPSKSADAARREEFAAIDALPIRERMMRALELGHLAHQLHLRFAVKPR